MPSKRLPVHDIRDFHDRGTESDFYANTISQHQAQHGNLVFAPHRHTFYLSMLIIRGSGIHEIDFQAYDIRPGAVFLLFPGQVHNWTISPDTEGYIIFHGTEFYNLNFTHEKIEHYPFFCSTQNTPLIRLKPNQLPGIEILFNTIVLEYQQQHLMCFQKVSSLLNVLYIDLSRLYLPAGRRAELGEKQLAQIRCLELLIETHFKVIKSPLKYAEMMFMSQRNLNRIVGLVRGKTVTDLIADKVILEAKRMLIYSRLTIAEISADLGYPDNSYFTRLFRKKTGHTPMSFQKEYLRQHEGWQDPGDPH